MEEALEILWTYARREPLDSNGEIIVLTINNSIAAIRIIMRLEGWAMGSKKSLRRNAVTAPAHRNRMQRSHAASPKKSQQRPPTLRPPRQNHHIRDTKLSQMF